MRVARMAAFFRAARVVDPYMLAQNTFSLLPSRSRK
jgi:hypothetical protein